MMGFCASIIVAANDKNIAKSNRVYFIIISIQFVYNWYKLLYRCIVFFHVYILFKSSKVSTRLIVLNEKWCTSKIDTLQKLCFQSYLVNLLDKKNYVTKTLLSITLMQIKSSLVLKIRRIHVNYPF